MLRDRGDDDDMSIVLKVPLSMRRRAKESLSGPAQKSVDDVSEVFDANAPTHAEEDLAVEDASVAPPPEALLALTKAMWLSLSVTVLHQIRVRLGKGSIEELSSVNKELGMSLTQVAGACARGVSQPTNKPCDYVVDKHPILTPLAASIMFTARAHMRFVDEAMDALMRTQREFLHFATTVFQRAMKLDATLQAKQRKWTDAIEKKYPEQTRMPFVIHAACDVADMQSSARTVRTAHTSTTHRNADMRRVDALDERVRSTIARLLALTREKRATMLGAASAKSQQALNALIHKLTVLDEETVRLKNEVDTINKEQAALLHYDVSEPDSSALAPPPSSEAMRRQRQSANLRAQSAMHKCADVTARRKVLLTRLQEETDAAREAILMECTEQLQAGLHRYRSAYEACMARGTMVRDASTAQSMQTTGSLRHQLAGFGGYLPAADKMMQCAKNIVSAHVCSKLKQYVVFVNKLQDTMLRSLST